MDLVLPTSQSVISAPYPEKEQMQRKMPGSSQCHKMIVSLPSHFFHEKIQEMLNILCHEISLDETVITETIKFSAIKCHL